MTLPEPVAFLGSLLVGMTVSASVAIAVFLEKTDQIRERISYLERRASKLEDETDVEPPQPPAKNIVFDGGRRR